MAEKNQKDGTFKKFESSASLINNLLSIWTLVGVVVLGFLTSGIIQIWHSALNVGWEYWVIILIFTIPFTLIGIQWALWKYSVFKNKRKEPSEDTSALVARIEALENANKGEDVAKVVAPLIQAADKAMQDRFDNFTEVSNRRIDGLFKKHKQNNALIFANIAEILEHKNTLERFNQETKVLEEIIEKLEPLPPCKDWNNYYKAFKTKLSHWDSYKHSYPIPAYRPLFSVNPEELKPSKWDNDVNEIDDEDFAMDYKHYRIYKDAFEFNKLRLHSRILDASRRTVSASASDPSLIKKFSD